MSKVPPQIVDGNHLIDTFFHAQSISHTGSGRFVDDTQHIESGELAGIPGGLSLGIIKISWDGDDRLGDIFLRWSSAISLSCFKIWALSSIGV